MDDWLNFNFQPNNNNNNKILFLLSLHFYEWEKGPIVLIVMNGIWGHIETHVFNALCIYIQ